jgi:hypothetical protein
MLMNLSNYWVLLHIHWHQSNQENTSIDMVKYYPGTRGMTNNQQLVANTPGSYTQPDKDTANRS